MPERDVTLDRLISHAGARLGAAGLHEPRREAWRIWTDLAGPSPFGPSIFSEAAVPSETAERFRLAVDRRARGAPLPYATGVAGFRQLVLRSDRRALIPRPETEGLVELLLGRQPEGRVADIGTGSGCIALALAEEGRYDQVVGVDRSGAALSLARENRQVTGLNIDLVAGDLTQALGDHSLDAIIANPPYLTEGEYDRLDASVRAWEPREALVGGGDGLEAYRALLGDARRVVRADGWLALEVDTSRAGATGRLAEAMGWTNVTVHDDLFGRARYLLARRSEAL
ncbi:MAG TPA: peptide chain release factor N(5)-glutamine methyltransferase [Gemmatimonadales bacterium]|nr:peptide chain release factor N(5)-glutamine methyltransferase [Gemmatimonadales bacterium]